MNTNYGGQSMIDTLRRVLVRRPDEAFGNADPVRWHYTAQPNLEIACQEHDALVEMLRQANIEVIYNEAPLSDKADAIYVRDPMLMCEQGAIILSMGKPLRKGEEIAMANTLKSLDIPIHYTLHGDALAEGGDLLWVDSKTLAVGEGFRTNATGVAQLREALEPSGVEVISVHLPYDKGVDACLHLTSFISIVGEKMAVVYLPLIPVPFWQYLKARDFHLIEVPEAEYETLAPNVLAIAPGVCLMLEGNPITQQRLQKAGCEVSTYKGYELSFKSEGGVTCLTRPILRKN